MGVGNKMCLSDAAHREAAAAQQAEGALPGWQLLHDVPLSVMIEVLVEYVALWVVYLHGNWGRLALRRLQAVARTCRP